MTGLYDPHRSSPQVTTRVVPRASCLSLHPYPSAQRRIFYLQAKLVDEAAVVICMCRRSKPSVTVCHFQNEPPSVNRFLNQIESMRLAVAMVAVVVNATSPTCGTNGYNCIDPSSTCYGGKPDLYSCTCGIANKLYGKIFRSRL